ncbi:unnamed protein product, partial [Rangifer tarandus platyrhynchus]
LLVRSSCLESLGGSAKAKKSGEGAARGGGHRAAGLCAACGQETAQASPQATANAGLRGCPPKAFPPLAKEEGRCAAAGCRAGQRRRGRAAFHWEAKATSTSFEPESNQRPKDDHTCRIYSPPLYQLSYRRVRATKRPGTFLFPEMPLHDTGTLVGSPFEESRARGRQGAGCGCEDPAILRGGCGPAVVVAGIRATSFKMPRVLSAVPVSTSGDRGLKAGKRARGEAAKWIRSRGAEGRAEETGTAKPAANRLGSHLVLFKCR